MTRLFDPPICAHRRRNRATLFVAAICVAFGLAGGAGADAEPRAYQGARLGPHDVALQARSCVGEIGHAFERRRPRWDMGCAAIAGVHARRAARQGWTLGAMARAYSAPLKPGSPHGWVRHLSDLAEPPRGWPARVSWSRHRPLFRHALEVVRRTFAGELADPCESLAPEHHGGREGVDDDLGPGWREVDCDRSPQRFYVRADLGAS